MICHQHVFLNNLEYKQIPYCISTLNDFEKILIQRAKAFQVITRMTTVQGNKNKPCYGQVPKSKGRVFHFPLPLEQTLEKLPQPTDAIIRQQDLFVLVRGLPTKQNHIWQSLVNINKVYSALIWLKENNPLYENIIIPSRADDLLKQIGDCDVEDFNEINNVDEQTCNNFKKAGILTQKEPDDRFYENMIIHPLFEKRVNYDASTLYQFVKVIEKSLDNRALNLDLMCFPDLFPYGVHGKNQIRESKLGVAEFIKLLLMSKNSQFRLNIQYLFFMLNDANIRQLKAGIFHKLNVQQ